MQTRQDRRRFLVTLSAVGSAALIGPPGSNAQSERLETTTVRIAKIAGICIAPQYAADELLRAEGFTDIRYVPADAGLPAARALTRGEIFPHKFRTGPRHSLAMACDRSLSSAAPIRTSPRFG